MIVLVNVAAVAADRGLLIDEYLLESAVAAAAVGDGLFVGMTIRR